MKKLVIFGAFLIMSMQALAQQQMPTKFVPFTMEEQIYNTIIGMLAELKWKDAQPILLVFGQLEQKAMSEARMKEMQAPKVEEPQVPEAVK